MTGVQTCALPISWGDPARPPVLVVHGWEGRGSQLATFVPALRAAGFRVVAFDGPGHGQSRTQRSSAVHMALAIERIAQHTGPLAGVVAHSVGGAATVLAFHLSRGALDVKRCVLVAPPVSAKRFFDGFCAALGLHGVTRIAISPKGDRIAFVTQP